MMRYLLLGLALAACSSRKPPAARDDAAPPAPADAALDASRYLLGSFHQIYARFDAACGSDRNHENYKRSCTRPLSEIRRDAPDDAHRYMYFGIDVDGEVDEAVDTLEVAYSWQTSGRPPECDHVIEDAVGYAKDLTGLSDRDAARLVATMRAHPWKAGTWSKVRLGGHDFYFEYFDHSAKQPTCLAGFSQPALILPSVENLIEEVEPAPL